MIAYDKRLLEETRAVLEQAAKNSPVCCFTNNDNIEAVLIAIDKRVPKKPALEFGRSCCPRCFAGVKKMDGGSQNDYCPRCGQRLDWE